MDLTGFFDLCQELRTRVIRFIAVLVQVALRQLFEQIETQHPHNGRVGHQDLSFRGGAVDANGGILIEAAETFFTLAQCQPSGARFFRHAGRKEPTGRYHRVSGKTKSAGIDGINGQILCGMAGQQNTLAAGEFGSDFMQQFQTGHIFQVQVDQGHVNIGGLRRAAEGCRRIGQNLHLDIPHRLPAGWGHHLRAVHAEVLVPSILLSE